MLVPCEDGKEFIGNPFKITTSVRDVPASAASLSEGLPQFFSVFGSGGSRVGWLYQVDDLKEAMRSEAGWQVRYCLGLAL